MANKAKPGRWEGDRAATATIRGGESGKIIPRWILDSLLPKRPHTPIRIECDRCHLKWIADRDDIEHHDGFYLVCDGCEDAYIVRGRRRGGA